MEFTEQFSSCLFSSFSKLDLGMELRLSPWQSCSLWSHFLVYIGIYVNKISLNKYLNPSFMLSEDLPLDMSNWILHDLFHMCICIYEYVCIYTHRHMNNPLMHVLFIFFSIVLFAVVFCLYLFLCTRWKQCSQVSGTLVAHHVGGKIETWHSGGSDSGLNQGPNLSPYMCFLMAYYETFTSIIFASSNISALFFSFPENFMTNFYFYILLLFILLHVISLLQFPFPSLLPVSFCSSWPQVHSL